VSRDDFDYVFDMQELRSADQDAVLFRQQAAAARAAAQRCDGCGYVLASPGHRIACGAAAAERAA
jgi:hypothetical protein